MKKSLTLIFILALVLIMSLSVFAGDAYSGQELKSYLEEKIIPIIVGVVTSLVALIGTLKSIFSALKQLKSTKESFDLAQTEIKESTKSQLGQISQKYEELRESIKGVPELEKHILELSTQVSTLISQISNLSQLTAIGFCESAELVSSGKGREIALLASKNQVVMEDEEK